jgi:penicillin-binding protein 1A
MKKKSKKSKKHPGRNLIFRILIYFFSAGIILTFLLFLTVYFGGFGSVPDQDELKQIRNYTASEIYSSDNYLLGRYYVENRTNTSIERVPEFLIKALIATEDARFYDHQGVDTRSTIRVLVKSILLFNRNSGGGSTITQQLAKNLYRRKNFGFLTIPVAKIREILIALRLEKVYTKSEILQLYLNTVPFGDNTFGIETAALVYFNKQTQELLPQESAVLVGLLKGNSYYNPRTHKDAARERRNVVLNQMVRYHYLSKDDANALKALPVSLNYRKIKHDEGPAPYFREYLRKWLDKWADENPKSDGSKYNIYTDGLIIYTTIDYRMQSYAERAAAQHMKQLQKEFDAHWRGKEPWKHDIMLAKSAIVESQRYKILEKKKLGSDELFTELKKPVNTKIFTWEGEKTTRLSPLDSILHHFAMLQTGMISMESRTGFIKAWIGGIDFRYFKYDHVTSKRQAGSTFKPVVYAAALKHGFSPCDYFANDSVVYTEYDNWMPRNADRTYGGYYSMKGALAHSVNTVSAEIFMETGAREVVELAHNMGIESDLPEVPSLSLGTGEVSLLEMVRAYSVFVNKGYRIEPIIIRRIEDHQGNVIYTRTIEESDEPILSEKTCQQMLAMLEGVVNRGTASGLRTIYGITSHIAGKTGTTQNQTDGWFIGVTPDLITGIWVGGDNPVVRFRNITYGQGSYMAMPIFARYMQKLYSDPVFNGLKSSVFNIPDEILATLDCDDYREKEFDSLKEVLEKTEESIGDFIRRIFSKKKRKKDSGKTKDENND